LTSCISQFGEEAGDTGERGAGIARELYADDTLLDLEGLDTVYALDSSTIDLCLSVFPWAPFRSTKAAIKLHTLLDLRGSIPSFIFISDGKIANQVLREVRINPPIAHRICVRHRVAGNARTAKTQVVQLGGLRFKTGFDVPQTLAPCELGESKTMELVMTREMLDLVIAIITGNATTKNVPRNVTHDLRENVLASVHGPSVIETDRRGRKKPEKIQVDNGKKGRFT
jgi:hypothetical protein